MPDAEIFKLILNGGLFGLLLLIAAWLMFYGAPILRDIGIKHEETIQRMNAENKAERETRDKAVAEEREKAAADALAERKQLNAECREEREARDERFERVVAEIVRGQR